MPHIIVVADGDRARGDGAVTLRERINLRDMESGHFATQLLERLSWAVGDATDVELRGQPAASVVTTAS